MNNIKKIRKEHNVLQKKLAYDLNLTQEAISSYETGRVTPSAEILIKLAKYFDTSIDYILCITEHDVPVSKLKPNDISKDLFQLVTKISKLSDLDRSHVESYLNFLSNK